MKVTRLAARNFLSLGDVDTTVDETLTVVTGPNGVGKTSIARVVNVVVGALRAHSAGRWDVLDGNYGGAGRFGSPNWSVTLGVTFDDAELALFDDWLRGCLLALSSEQENQSTQVADLVLAQKDIGTAELFTHGAFRVDYDLRRRQPWKVWWLTGLPTTTNGEQGHDDAADDTVTARAAEDTRRVGDVDTNRGVRDEDDERTRSVSDNTDDNAPTGGTPDSGEHSPHTVIRIDLTSNFAVADGAAQTRPQFGQLSRDAILGAQERAGVAQGLGQPVPNDFMLPTVADLARLGGVDLAVTQTNNEIETAPVQNVLDALGIDNTVHNQRVVLARVAERLFDRSVVVVENVRGQPLRQWDAADLEKRRDLASGEQLALALWADKNGDADGRARFALTQKLFGELGGTTATLDVTASPGLDQPDGPAKELTITPVVTDGTYDIPLHLSGAGQSEVALIAALLATDPPVLVLDEPATNLSTAAQRRVTAALQRRSAHGRQTILITHSSNLVPIGNVQGLLTLSRSPDGAIARRVVDTSLASGRERLLRLPSVRDALFASGVLLTEGESDEAALRVWLDQAEPTPEQAGVLLVGVGGDASFVPHFEVLDALGIPWAAFVDGPALTRRLPGYDRRAPRHDFETVRRYWAARGVHTLARSFGVDDARGDGELEAFFARLDPTGWAGIAEAHKRNKPLAAARFAEATPIPDEVSVIWSDVLDYLGLRPT